MLDDQTAAVLHRAVEAYGGTVRAESTPHERTVFRMTLPEEAKTV